ncbi:MAG TPA: head GIN domain-containing protein, partial [Saprospiraceae bacterium]|nr:head GIN domain-containing protein [Saprospiraceae bacterium]HMQ85368.1 head GIN domain-containing protein [Saprospiraceae bacterium]
MMKQIKWIVFTAAIALLTPACFIDVDDDDGFFGGNCISGEGETISQQLDVSDFDGIELDLAAKVVLRQGNEFEVIAEGKENVIDRLDLDVRNGIWEIDTDRCIRSLNGLTIYITMPEVKVLRIAGSGEIYGENTLITGDLELDISGSGDMDLVVESDDIQADISGSGKLILSGLADEVDYDISGSGDIRAFGLECNRADVSISGSGDVEVFVLEFLKVRISGSGDVFYKGNPSLDISISGSGDVI